MSPTLPTARDLAETYGMAKTGRFRLLFIACAEDHDLQPDHHGGFSGTGQLHPARPERYPQERQAGVKGLPILQILLRRGKAGGAKTSP